MVAPLRCRAGSRSWNPAARRPNQHSREINPEAGPPRKLFLMQTILVRRGEAAAPSWFPDCDHGVSPKTDLVFSERLSD
jgi:hypothetical protein